MIDFVLYREHWGFKQCPIQITNRQQCTEWPTKISVQLQIIMEV